MFICAFVLSLILIGFASFTRQRVDANRQIGFERALLESLAISLPQDRIKIHKIFIDTIKPPQPDTAGAYQYIVDGELLGFALPVAGQGFWAPIKAIIGIAADKKSIIGFGVYEQNETPGLGAEIAKSEFKKQFAKTEGKMISPTDEAFALRSVGESLKPNEVYAVTGATQTSVRLEKILNDALTDWRNKMLTEIGI